MRLVDAFRPDFGKVTIAILLLLSSAVVLRLGITCVEGGLVVGFPLAFFIQCNDLGPQGVTPGVAQVNPVSLILDIAVWYVVGASVSIGVRKLRPRRDEQID